MAGHRSSPPERARDSASHRPRRAGRAQGRGARSSARKAVRAATAPRHSRCVARGGVARHG